MISQEKYDDDDEFESTINLQASWEVVTSHAV